MSTATKPPTNGRARQVKSGDLDPARDQKVRRVKSGLYAASLQFIIAVVTGGRVSLAIGSAVIIGVVVGGVSS